VIKQLYIENGVGRAVMDAINLFTPKHGVTAVWQHDIHPQMQRKQEGDEWWIKDIAAKGMAALTQDRTILGVVEAAAGITSSERQAVIESEAHIVAFGNARYSTWDKLRCVVNHWDVIDQLLQLPGPRAVELFLSRATLIELP
jgi:hypothetical protein